jgi:hypothetical protein
VKAAASSFSDKAARSMSYTEMLCIIVGAVAFVLVSCLIAMAAELAISVHYFEKPTVPSFEAVDKRQRELLTGHHRVTSEDPEIASVRAKRLGLNRLARVIQRSTDPSGHPRALLVVEEVAPIETTSQNETKGTQHIMDRPPPLVDYQRLATVRPKLCKDHLSVGFDSWSTLKAAVDEANTLSVERFVRWSRYFAEAEDFRGTFLDDSLYYEEDIVLPICPGIRLKARRGPIFINCPNLILTCDGCEISVGGSHFSFGTHAKHVLLRGITFRGATTSSLVFFNHGAFVSFEDCAWFNNAAITGRFGAVADVNSTSVVNFYRCHIGNSQKGEAPGLASSLSVRG